MSVVERVLDVCFCFGEELCFVHVLFLDESAGDVDDIFVLLLFVFLFLLFGGDVDVMITAEFHRE